MNDLSTVAPAMGQSNGRHRQTLSLATVLAVSFGGLVAVAVLAVGLIGFSTGRANTLALLNDKSTLMVGLLERGVRGHLNPALHQARFIDGAVRSGVVDVDDPDQLGDVLTGMLAAAPQILAVVYWDLDLNMTIARVLPDRRIVVERMPDQGPDSPRLQQEARAAGQGFWGRLVFEAGEVGATIVNYIQPLHHDGGFVGVAGIALTMPELSEFITRVGDQFDATGYILYGDDQVLAHHQLTSRHPDLNPDNPTVAINRLGDVVLAALPTAEPVRGLEPAAGISVDLVEVAGGQYVAFNGVLDEFGPVPWTVGAYVPAEQVNNEVIALLRAGVAGVAVLVASIIAAVVLGKLLARPIRLMAAEAIQVGELELGAVAPLPPSRIRELEDQASAFNRMLTGLKWFETYVPRSLVKRLVASGEGEVVSGERDLTILFTDIVGFTELSETMPAATTAKMLNDHFALIGACVEAEGGTIDKFIGDALMAFWGAPDDQPDHAARACRAALAMVTAVAADNLRRQARGEVPLRVRVGLYSGPVVVGNIGAPGRMNYTIVGDTVNAAHRLESLAKDLDEGDDVTVLVGGATVAASGPVPGVGAEPVGAFEVKGKKAPLEVFRLRTGAKGDGQEPAAAS